MGDRRQAEGFDAVAVVGDREGQLLARCTGRRRHVGRVARIDGDVEQFVDEQVDAVRIDRRRPGTGVEARARGVADGGRSEEHTPELQLLMRISYAVFCWKKKTEVTRDLTTTCNTKCT